MTAVENPQQNVTFPSNGAEAHGYLALPPSDHGPGLIVIQEWWGLTSHVAEMTDRFAAEGFVALAPDLYGGATTHDADEAQELMGKMPVDRAARDLSGAVDFLLAHDAVTGSAVGAVGFCMGGGFVIRLAAEKGAQVAAAVAFYGVPQLMPDDFSGISAEILGNFAEQDQMVPTEAVTAVADKLTSETGKAPTIYFYPAGHAFMNDENLMGTYDADQAALAWDRSLAFLHDHLG